jgi:hypothetical protein
MRLKVARARWTRGLFKKSRPLCPIVILLHKDRVVHRSTGSYLLLPYL